MDERAHPLGLPQLVVEPDRLLGLPDVRGDTPVLQHSQGLRGDAEPLVEALREHHRRGAVLQQLLDVGGLDAWLVVRAGLVPVPRPRASGEEFGVLEGAFYALDLKASPGEVGDLRGVRFSLHRAPPYGIHRLAPTG